MFICIKQSSNSLISFSESTTLSNFSSNYKNKIKYRWRSENFIDFNLTAFVKKNTFDLSNDLNSKPLITSRIKKNDNLFKILINFKNR